MVGLGNPGMEDTRHSVGMAVLGALAARLGLADRWRGDKHVSGEVIVSEVERTQVVLLRPRLLMNINGVSVAKAGEVIIVCVRLIHCYVIFFTDMSVCFSVVCLHLSINELLKSDFISCRKKHVIWPFLIVIG